MNNNINNGRAQHMYKGFVISGTYAVIKPRAVMIESLYTTITDCTVFGMLYDMCLAYIAKVFVIIWIEFDLTTALKRLSLQIHCLICRIDSCALYSMYNNK